MALFRATAGELARVNNHGEVVNAEYTGTTTAILAELLDGDVIPNTSGLAGAEPLTKATVVTVVSYLQAVLGYNTQAHRANLAKAAGEANLIG
jgi:hypothetical protein